MTAQAAAPLARVALARSPVRMLGPVFVALLVGAAALGLGAVLIAQVGFGAAVVGLLVGGGVALAIGLWLAARVLSLRLLIEPGYLHLRGLGTDRRFKLARGKLARLPTAGPRKVGLSVRLGSLGWTVGQTALPSGERVHVIRLGATPSVILVPTEQGRVALAVASEAAFVDALVEAARIRAAQPPPAEAIVPGAPAAEPAPASSAAAAVLPAPASMTDMPVPPPTAALSAGSAVAGSPTLTPATPFRFPREPEPHRARPLTGIERMWLEDKLARERRAALAGAREEHAAASFTASVAALTPAGGRVVPTIPAPVAEATGPASAYPVPAPAALASTPALAVPAAVAASTVAAPAASAAALPTVIPRRRPLRRPMARRVAWPELPPNVVLIATPLVGALASWLLAVILGDTPGASGMDPVAAALLLCGPIAGLAVFLAYNRWPRLAGLSSVSAMIALLLVVRALIGSA
jgi:hypothetical protein